jgi:surface polysaccharide O-acyltransferase-like enzyme
MSQFFPHIHNLRGAAILFIVAVHARGGVADWSSHPGVNRLLQVILDAQEGNGTVMFVFIAGFLFQHLNHQRFEFKKYLEQKFKVIILPYIIISVPLILFRIATNFDSVTLPADFSERSVFHQFFYHLFTGSHIAPFWFINMIIIIYLSTPLLHKLDNPKFYQYVFPFILMASLFTYRPLHNANPVLAYLHFIPVYMTGMWASFYKKEILSIRSRFFWSVVAAYVALCVLDLTGWMPPAAELNFENILGEGMMLFNIYILRALLLCFIFLILLYKLRNKKMPLLELLGEYSFGIFFVHFILIMMTRRLLSVLYGPIDFSLLTFLIYFLFILLASIVTVFFIKKLTGRYSRNLIGS